jgi:hypothetical protein
MITEMTEEEQRRLIGDLARELADFAADKVKDVARPLAVLLAINGAINARWASWSGSPMIPMKWPRWRRRQSSSRRDSTSRWGARDDRDRRARTPVNPSKLMNTAFDGVKDVPRMIAPITAVNALYNALAFMIPLTDDPYGYATTMAEALVQQVKLNVRERDKMLEREAAESAAKPISLE